LGQWLTAVLSHKGESDAMDPESALTLVHPTQEIWRCRRDHHGERGRA